MEPAKLIIEVTGGDGLEESPVATQPPGARPETPAAPPIPPPEPAPPPPKPEPAPQPPEPPSPIAPLESAVAKPKWSGASFGGGVEKYTVEGEDATREEFYAWQSAQFPPRPEPPAAPSAPPATPVYALADDVAKPAPAPDMPEAPEPPPIPPPVPPPPVAEVSRPAGGEQPPAPPEPPAAPPADDGGDWYPRYRELQNRLDMGGELKPEEAAELRKLAEAIQALADAWGKAPPAAPPAPAVPESPERPAERPPVPEAPPLPARPADDTTYNLVDEPPRIPKPPAEEPTTYDFKKPTAYPVPQEEEERIPLADETYEAEPPPAPPPPPKPPLPRAEVISDAEKSREQWSPSGAMQDLKGYLPFGIGQKFGGKFQAMGAAYSNASAEAAAGGASRAGAMAAGVGEAALAAGPAAIVGISLLAAKKIEQMYEQGLQHMGQRGTELARNNYAGLLEDGAKAAKLGLIALGPVGMAASSALTLATPAIKEFTKVAHAFVERGQYLAKYNSDLGAAQARSYVRTTLADVRESEALAPSIGRTTDNMSQMDVGIRDLLLPIKQGISELLAAGTDIGREVVELLRPLAPVIKYIVQFGTAVPVATLKIFAEVIAMFRKALEKWPFNVKFDGDQKEGDLNSMLSDFLKASDRIVGPFAPGMRQPGAPIFGRG